MVYCLPTCSFLLYFVLSHSLFLIGIQRQLREQAAFTRADACRIFNKQAKVGCLPRCEDRASQWFLHVAAKLPDGVVHRFTKNIFNLSMPRTRYLAQKHWLFCCRFIWCFRRCVEKNIFRNLSVLKATISIVKKPDICSPYGFPQILILDKHQISQRNGLDKVTQRKVCVPAENHNPGQVLLKIHKIWNQKALFVQVRIQLKAKLWRTSFPIQTSRIKDHIGPFGMSAQLKYPITAPVNILKFHFCPSAVKYGTTSVNTGVVGIQVNKINMQIQYFGAVYSKRNVSQGWEFSLACVQA